MLVGWRDEQESLGLTLDGHYGGHIADTNKGVALDITTPRLHILNGDPLTGSKRATSDQFLTGRDHLIDRWNAARDLHKDQAVVRSHEVEHRWISATGRARGPAFG
jgi:hypothetical protein